MTLGFEFHPEARAEPFADVEWYDATDVATAILAEVRPEL